ncbi:MAG: DUF4173 domain-containing protein, partial [Actinobacteria bacterium]|nr:DUF4173 domain-containing protein [Actinomycetota bacterium]
MSSRIEEVQLGLAEVANPDLGRTTSLLAAATGVIAALILPADVFGIAFVLAAVSAWTTVLSARPVAWKPYNVTLATISVLLVCMTAFKASEWILAIDLVAAVGFAFAAVTDARSWERLIIGAFTPLFRAFRSPAVLGRSLSYGRSDKAVKVIIGVAMGAALLIVFGALFSSADSVFGHFLSGLLPNLPSALPFRVFLFLFFSLGTVTLAISGPRFERPSDLKINEAVSALFGLKRGTDRSGPIDHLAWSIAIGSAIAMFAAFVFFQITVLFAGNQHVLTTQGLTYARYAREGFF